MNIHAAEPTPTVLIVDDDPDGRTSLGWILQASGFDIREAGTAAEAFRLVAEGPHLIVLDVVLPDLSGVEVCRRLKADPSTAITPVLMVSGHAVGAGDQASALDCGADAYLTKPADPGLLVAHLRALLRVRRAEEAVRASERRWRAVVEHSFDATNLIAADGSLLYASPSSARLLGRALGGRSGRDVFELAHPDDLPRVRSAFTRLLTDHHGYVESVLRVRHADGTYRWLETRATNLLADPDVRAVVVNFRDVTDRRRLEAERDKLLSRLQLHIERLPLAYVLLDADLRIVDWNPAAERTFGYPRDEVLGMGPPYERLVPPGHRAGVAEALHRARSGDMTAHSVNGALTKDGRTITCEWHNTPLLTAEGDFTGVLCLVQDITAKRVLEEQFRQAQKMEAVGQLAGGVAHDFNNLLTAINGYCEILLERTAASDPSRELLEEIRKAGERSAGLTQQLLAFSRRQVLAPQVLDLNTVVMDAAKLLQRMIGEDVQLVTSLTPGLGAVRADPGQMEQVLLNLAVNARDAMPRGGRLTVRTANEKLDEGRARALGGGRAGAYVVLAASDTGAGMTAEVRERLFEPFFTTKGVGEGTGLGLAVVHGVVNQSGGLIEVESEVGRGTTFRIYLPRVETGTRPEAARSGIRGLRQGTETVLVVEDEAAVRALVRRVLGHVGYTVLEAASGEAALTVAAGHSGPIHILVTDVVMPGMGGRELAERLVARHTGLKVLFVSGYTDDAVVRHGVLTAHVAFLQKPFTPGALATKVREVLDQ